MGLSVAELAKGAGISVDVITQQWAHKGLPFEADGTLQPARVLAWMAERTWRQPAKARDAVWQFLSAPAPPRPQAVEEPDTRGRELEFGPPVDMASFRAGEAAQQQGRGTDAKPPDTLAMLADMQGSIAAALREHMPTAQRMSYMSLAAKLAALHEDTRKQRLQLAERARSLVPLTDVTTLLQSISSDLLEGLDGLAEQISRRAASGMGVSDAVTEAVTEMREWLADRIDAATEAVAP